MDSKVIEKNCISRILSINNAKYSIGILEEQGLLICKEWINCVSRVNNGSFQRIEFSLKTKEVISRKSDKDVLQFVPVDCINMKSDSNSIIDIANDGLQLLISEEWISCEFKLEDETFQRIDFNLKTKEVRIIKKDRNESDNIPVSVSNMESVSVIDISNDGLRWEGPCVDQSPFGYGSLYNSSNELIYRGVMIGNSKECFGINFYPGLRQIEYAGCYWNNEKHGFGMLYDRKGELVYEGDWLCGSSEYERSVVLYYIDNDRMVHSLIHELVIDEGCNNDYKGDLLLCGFDHLEKLVVKNSFVNVNSLKIHDNCILKSIEIEDAVYNETEAFHNVKNVTITRMMIFD